MLYTITGWNLKDNGACTLSTLLASFNALQKKRSTLLFQLTNPREIPVENILIGKQIMDSRLDILDTVVFDDVGIDALLRMSKTQDLDQDAFQQAVTPICEGSRRLDLLRGSTKQDFELETMENFEVVAQALTAAQAVYDDVFILLPEENRPLCIHFYENVSGAVNIRCLPQRVPDRLVRQKDFVFVLMDYEPASIYTARVIRKAIGIKSIYYFLRNVHLNDAAIQGTLLSFVEKNIGNDAADDNFPLFKGISSFLDAWEKPEEKAEEEEPKPACYRLLASTAKAQHLTRVDNEAHVRTVKTQKRFLHPSYEYMQVNTEGFDSSVEENAEKPAKKGRAVRKAKGKKAVRAKKLPGKAKESMSPEPPARIFLTDTADADGQDSESFLAETPQEGQGSEESNEAPTQGIPETGPADVEEEATVQDKAEGIPVQDVAEEVTIQDAAEGIPVQDAVEEVTIQDVAEEATGQGIVAPGTDGDGLEMLDDLDIPAKQEPRRQKRRKGKRSA